MSKMDQARSIRNLANLYRDMVGAADALEQLGSLEQAQKEAQAQVDAGRAELGTLRSELEHSRDDLKAAKAQVKKLTEDGKAAAAVAAGAITREAEVRAAEIVKAAQDKAAQITAEATIEKSRLSSEVAGLQSAAESLKTELQVLREAVDKIEAEKLAAEKRLADFKAKLAAL